MSRSNGAGQPAAEPSPASKPAGSPTALEHAIQERRDHLAATIDELSARAQPKEIARRSAIGVRQRAMGLTHTPDGQWRKERLVAVAGALAVVAGVVILIRRRK